MADNILTCPHCHGQIKAIPLNGSRPKRAAPGRGSHTFQHTVNDNITVTRQPPKNRLLSLFWFLRGNSWEPEPEPGPNDVTIYAEIRTDTQKTWFLDRLDSRIQLAEIWKIANLVIKDGENFSRPVLTKKGQLSQNKFHLISDEFRRLNYCFVTKANRTELTPKGETFLSAVLEKYPSPP